MSVMGLRYVTQLLLLNTGFSLLFICFPVTASTDGYGLLDRVDDTPFERRSKNGQIASFYNCILQTCQDNLGDQRVRCALQYCGQTQQNIKLSLVLLDTTLGKLICAYQLCSAYRNHDSMYRNCTRKYCNIQDRKLEESRGDSIDITSRSQPPNQGNELRQWIICRRLCEGLAESSQSLCADNLCQVSNPDSISTKKRAIFSAIGKCASAYCGSTRGRERIFCLRTACHRGR